MKSLVIEHEAVYADRQELGDWSTVVREEQARTTSLLAPVLMGLAVLSLGFGSFVAWAATTPLTQAAVASGQVIVESKTKTVTHLEGGTLVALLVQEGDSVQEQQPLIQLDVVRSQAAATRLKEELFSARVKLARLLAERAEQANFEVTTDVQSTVAPVFAEKVINAEQQFMNERNRLYKDQLSIDTSLIEQATKQREAYASRRESLSEQLQTAQKDYDVLSKLAESKLATRAQLSQAKYALSEIQSELLQLESQIAESEEKRNQFVLNRMSRTSEHVRAISEETQATQIEIAKLTQELVAADDVVSKSVIRSPQAGIVANIKIRTPGSAVIPGAPILDIVPAESVKLIEGRARAVDIQSLRVGLKAEIRLRAFNAAEAEPIIGKIIYIAPDSTTNEQTGEVTYAFRAEIPDAELKKQPNVFLHPGMAADVYIVAGDRTALEYLLLPVKESFARAFRER